MMENGGWMTNGYGGSQERPWAEGGTVLASKDRCQGWEQDAKGQFLCELVETWPRGHLRF